MAALKELFLTKCRDGKQEVLLLTRNSSHYNATLSVPGGNVDLGDEHLLATATREAYEEMGASPDFEVRGEVDTRPVSVLGPMQLDMSLFQISSRGES